MIGKLNLAFICMQVCLECKNFWIAAAGLSEEIQTGEMFNVPHPRCVHLHEFFYPFRLILGAIAALVIVGPVREDEGRHRERAVTLVSRLSEIQAAGDDAVVVCWNRNGTALHVLLYFVLCVM